jgi:hypothetical protein
MPSYAHDENIALYVKLLAESAQNTSARHKMLLRLLAEEKAKDRAPPAEFADACTGRPAMCVLRGPSTVPHPPEGPCCGRTDDRLTASY